MTAPLGKERARHRTVGRDRDVDLARVAAERATALARAVADRDVLLGERRIIGARRRVHEVRRDHEAAVRARRHAVGHVESGKGSCRRP